jgi:hypothetical protein
MAEPSGGNRLLPWQDMGGVKIYENSTMDLTEEWEWY